MKYNEKIVALRKANGYTQEGFARAVGVTRQAVYKWEVGDSYPEAEKLIAIKALFGISIDDLLDDSFDVIVEKAKKPARKKTLPPVPAVKETAPVVEAPAAEAAPAPAPVVEAPAAEAAPAPAPVVEAPAAEAAPAPVVEAPAAAPAPAAAAAAPAPAADDLDEFDFVVAENNKSGASGNLFDVFIKKN